ncbi:hypothetical protein LSCM1_05589 [Leishmania martiniquensis]|uniref:Uncharacterized protein n=1 Tax=Leishmania martiniquensis TaxID=1580590 RepID=A0A836KSX1_9TRYP|nr:hypothetical protein LSCM1_05589 [Leishmania martiniquensis]
MISSATRQLRVLRATQHRTRMSVEERIAAYEAARHAYETAQRQEAELRAMLRAAEARTAQRLLECEDAEAELSNAAANLSHTQSLCHSLESRIAEHVRCQRSAVLLMVPPPSSLSPSSVPPVLCRMDPYSLLHTPTGEAFTYDLVELSGCTAGGMHSGEEGDEFSEEERGDVSGAAAQRHNNEGGDVDVDANQLFTTPSIKSLLTDAVRDVLHGYHHTFLSTSADGSCLGCQDDISASGMHAEDTAPSVSGIPPESCGHPYRHQWPGQPATLCLRLLQLLQREAARSGTRALSITLAAGCAGARDAARLCGTGAATSVASAPAAAASVWTDLLLPAAARHQQLTVTMEATPSEDYEETVLPLTTAGVKGFYRESGSNVPGDTWLEVGHMHHDSRAVPSSAPSSATANEPQPRTHAPTLEGVPVGSIEEAAFWLREADLLATCSTSKAHEDATTLMSSSAAPVGHRDAQAATVVLLVGVDSQDARGKLHKSLLRIVSDPCFDAGRLGRPRPEQMSGGKSRNGHIPLCCSPSAFALYMSHALESLARTAAAKTPNASNAGLCPASAKGEQSSATTNCPAQMLLLLLRGDVAPLTAGEIRNATHSFSSRCPAEVCAIAAADHGHASPPQLDAAWLLWASLLRPVFGGNSKALWLHYTTSASRGSGAGPHVAPKGISSPDGLRCPPSPDDDTAALRLSALFCRLVRHDAVAYELSPDLARLACLRP